MGRPGGKIHAVACALAVSAFLASLPASSAGVPCTPVGAPCELWASSYDTPRSDVSWAAAVAPDGTRAFVGGHSTSPTGPVDSTAWVLAYDGASGAPLWSVFLAPGAGTSTLFDGGLAVSPAGDTVYAAGVLDHAAGPARARAVAYDAATGAVVWSRDVAGAASVRIAALPDGDVIVAGWRFAGGAFLMRFDGATGGVVWDATYATGGVDTHPRDLAVDAAGTRIFTLHPAVDAVSWRPGVRAVAASDGGVLWVSPFGPDPATVDGAGSHVRALAASPDGSTVVVVGGAPNVDTWATAATQTTDALTVAYDASTGAQAWAASRPVVGGFEFAGDVAVTSTRAVVAGGALFVAGDAIRAYDLATGLPAWEHRGPPPGAAIDVEATRDGTRLFVAGGAVAGPVTTALEPSTGAVLWTARHGAEDGRTGRGQALAVSEGGQVFVAAVESASALVDSLEGRGRDDWRATSLLYSGIV